jgi:hypothetical protein
MRSWVGIICGALLMFVAATVSADVLKFARFHLMAGKSPNNYELDVQLPFVLTAAPSQDVALPHGCQLTSQNAQTLADQTSAVLKFACDTPVERGATIGVPWGEDGGVFTSSLTPDGATPRMIHGNEEGLAIPLDASSEQRSLAAVATEYTGLGIIHILEGLDHLAFVLCLCLLTRGATLLLLVTSFTLGHSVSLALSFLGVVSIPVPPVEATIALSWRGRRYLRDAAMATAGGRACATWRSSLLSACCMGWGLPVSSANSALRRVSELLV